MTWGHMLILLFFCDSKPIITLFYKGYQSKDNTTDCEDNDCLDGEHIITPRLRHWTIKWKKNHPIWIIKLLDTIIFHVMKMKRNIRLMMRRSSPPMALPLSIKENRTLYRPLSQIHAPYLGPIIRLELNYATTTSL